MQPKPLYHTSSRGYWDGSKWIACVNANANKIYSISINEDYNLIANVYKGPISWASIGIDTFAWTCRHEAEHVKWYSEWYPGGSSEMQVLSKDHDSIPDEEEVDLGYDPGYADSNGDGQPDCEDWVIRNQEVWVHYSAKLEDWANPGQQY